MKNLAERLEQWTKTQVVRVVNVYIYIYIYIQGTHTLPETNIPLENWAVLKRASN